MKSYDTRNKVIQYFQNPNILYHDWYESYYSSELFPGRPVAIMPSIDNIKQIFDAWLNERKEGIYNLICVEWDYLNKRKEYLDNTKLAIALADFLISATLKIPSPIALAVLLVQSGLDKFCELKI